MLNSCGDDAPLSILRPACALPPTCDEEFDTDEDDAIEASVVSGTEIAEPAIAAGTSCGDARFDVDIDGRSAM